GFFSLSLPSGWCIGGSTNDERPCPAVDFSGGIPRRRKVFRRSPRICRRLRLCHGRGEQRPQSNYGKHYRRITRAPTRETRRAFRGGHETQNPRRPGLLLSRRNGRLRPCWTTQNTFANGPRSCL